MMVFKYILPEAVTRGLPKGYRPLHVALQNGEPMIWCLVDPDAPLAPSGLFVIPTGANVVEGLEHVASFLMMGDSLVWHVFKEVANG